MDELRSLGIKTAMLTGDSSAAALQAQKEVSILSLALHARHRHIDFSCHRKVYNFIFRIRQEILAEPIDLFDYMFWEHFQFMIIVKQFFSIY